MCPCFFTACLPETRRCAWFILTAAVAVAGPAALTVRGQDSIRFDPAEHLEAYEEAQFSEYGILYRFAEFEALAGEKISAGRLQELRASWAEERARVEGEIRRIQRDPLARSVFLTEKRFWRHPFFSRISFEKDDTCSPIIFFIQKLQKPRDDYRPWIVNRYAPCLKKLAAVFRETFADPLGLTREDGKEADIVVVLSSYGSFTDYWRSCGRDGRYFKGVHYNPVLRVLVTYEDPLRKVSSEEKRAGLLYGNTYALIHAYAPGKALPEAHYWLQEGLARHFAAHTGGDGRSPLEPGAVDMAGCKDLAAMVRDPERRELYYLRVDELLEIAGPDDLYRRVGARVGKLAAKYPGWKNRALAHFQEEACLLVAYLLGEGRTQYGKLLARYMQDLCPKAGKKRPDRGPLFTAPELETLHGEFVEFMDRTVKRIAPDLAFDASLNTLLETFNRKSRDADTAGTTPLVDPGFQPAMLARFRTDLNLVLGKALYLAKEGRIQAAVRELEEPPPAAEPRGKEEEVRVQREVQRLEALAAWRDRLLDGCSAAHKKVRIKQGGKPYVGTLEAVEGDEVRLRCARSKTITAVLDIFHLLSLERRLRAEPGDLGAPWVEGYAALLAGKSAWERYLKGSSSEEEALRKDAPVFPDLLHSGEAAVRLERLADKPKLVTAKEGKAVLEEIRRLCATFKDTPCVAQVTPGLHQFAAHALLRIWERDGIGVLGLHGKIRKQPDGSVRLTYEFEHPEALKDFTALDYLSSRRKERGKVLTAEKDWGFSVRNGSLVGLGKACIRHRLAFHAPIRLTLEVLYRLENRLAPPDAWSFLVGLCDDGYGNNILCSDLTGLYALDKKKGFHASGAVGKFGIYMNEIYHIKIEHDGRRVKRYLDDEPIAQIPSGPLQGGYIFLWTHSDLPVEVQRLEIEGRLDPFVMDQVKEGWIREQIAALSGD